MKLILNKLNNYNASKIIHSNSLLRRVNTNYYSTLIQTHSNINNKLNQVDEYYTKQTEILKNTILLEYNSHKTLCNSFIRIQEFYENDQYYLQKINFSDLELNEYYSNWLGFNLPLLILKKFKLIYNRAELTKFELNLIDLVNKLESNNLDSNFYLIATSSSNPHLRETVKHEICHALYYLDEQFKFEANELLETIPIDQMSHLNQLMKSLHYHESVWKDEIQAYLISESFKSPFLLSKGVPIYTPFWQGLTAKLNTIYVNGVNRNKVFN